MKRKIYDTSEINWKNHKLHGIETKHEFHPRSSKTLNLI